MTENMRVIMTCCDDKPLPTLLRPFDPAPFMPRIECGNWPDWLVWGWGIPSLGLCLFYWTIAALVMILYRKTKAHRNGYPVGRLPWIAAFFVGCGGGHVMNLLAFSWPAYVAFVLWDWYTLVVSGVGVFAIYDVARWSFRRIDQLESGLHHALDDKQDAEAATARVQEALTAAEEKIMRKYRTDFAQNERRARELDGIREDLAALVGKQFMEEAYLALRKRLHVVRGTTV